jgi:uncharacterized membrane protein YccF (DUF307 family)
MTNVPTDPEASTTPPPSNAPQQPTPGAAPTYCTRCGQPNATTARFCASCGQPLAGLAYAPLSQQIINTINVTPAPAASPVVIVGPQRQGPGLITRGLYFIFVGWWLGALWTGLAWMLNATIIGLPLGLMMINRLPQVMTLARAASGMRVTVAGGATVVQYGAAQQYSFLVRAVYFLLVGWWFSGLWLGLAWGILAGTVGLGLPLSFWMFNRAPAITTLAR